MIATDKLKKLIGEEITRSYERQTASGTLFIDYLIADLDLSAEQVEISPYAPFVDHTLREANFRQAFGVIVVAIKRADGHMQFNPEPDDVIRAGDQLVALGNPGQLKALEDTASQRLRSGVVAERS